MSINAYAIYYPNRPETKNYEKISNQIQCVIREIRRREIYYPMAVIKKKMTQQQADYELNLMKAVYKTLTLAEQCHLDKKFNQLTNED